jgi:DNA-binding NarL/FixJ family response regulator
LPDSARLQSLDRDGLSRLLEDEGGFQVVGQASDGTEAVRLAQKLQPDALLLDLAMPRASGLDALRELAASKAGAKVLLLTVAIEDAQVVEALQLGARGVVAKEAATELLFKAIRSVVAGQYWVGNDTVTDIVHHLRELSWNGRRTATPAERLTTHPPRPQRNHGQTPRFQHLRQAGRLEPRRARRLRDEPRPGQPQQAVAHPPATPRPANLEGGRSYYGRGRSPGRTRKPWWVKSESTAQASLMPSLRIIMTKLRQSTKL